MDDTVIGHALNKWILPEQMRDAKKAEEANKTFQEKIAPVLTVELGDKQFFNGDKVHFLVENVHLIL